VGLSGESVVIEKGALQTVPRVDPGPSAGFFFLLTIVAGLPVSGQACLYFDSAVLTSSPHGLRADVF